MTTRPVTAFVLSLALGLSLAGGAEAADTLRVGKAVPFSWAFTPIEIGADAGIWAKNGLALQVTSFAGDAKVQQALTADSIDIALGGGPALAFIPKGVPAKGVASIAGPPYGMSLVVKGDSPLKTIADIKGKKLGVTTVGSMTEWLAKRMAIAEGWSQDGVTSVPLGGLEFYQAALKTGQVDGIVVVTEIGYAMEGQQSGRIVTDMSRYAPDFITNAIFARQALIDKQPDVVQRFVDGWFQTIAYMKANKDKSVAVSAQVTKQTPEVISRAYDAEMKMMSEDGVFDPKAVAVLKQSFVDMGVLDTAPTDDEILTRQFVPAKK